MAFHSLTTPFATPTLLAAVLADPAFARDGYLWGFDGHVHYCFCNPRKLRFEIWRKQYSFSWWWVLAGGLAFGAALGLPFSGGASLLALGPAAVAALILPRFYRKTAWAQQAPVFSVGPQMQLPGDMQNGTAMALLLGAAFGPAIVGALVGLLVGGGPVGIVALAVAGLLAGSGAAALLLHWMGQRSIPFGAVLSAAGNEPGVTPPVAGSFFFHRGARYAIGAGAPAAAEGSGGLTFWTAAAGVQFVLWGLIRWTAQGEPALQEAISSRREEYGEQAPAGELILVAGANPWLAADTIAMGLHRVAIAVACDGHASAMLGAFGECAAGLETHIHLDPIMRWGFKMVP